MESIGEFLRQARHDRKVSLEDAARVTKIKIEILEQLEADEFQKLPSPMYTKGFLKIYAEYLGLDSQSLGDAYLKSQGGLRRQGLHLETEVTARARKPAELELPLALVTGAVAVLTLGAVLFFAGRSWWNHHRQTPSVVVPAVSGPLPKADFEAYYQPTTRSAPEMLEPPKP